MNGYLKERKNNRAGGNLIITNFKLICNFKAFSVVCASVFFLLCLARFGQISSHFVLSVLLWGVQEERVREKDSKSSQIETEF